MYLDLQLAIFSILHKDILQAFLDSNEPQSMVISPNIAGHLHIHTDWPSALRNKGVYFVKKEKTPIPEDEVILSTQQHRKLHSITSTSEL